MKRRRFFGLFGGAAATAAVVLTPKFTPFVIAENDTPSTPPELPKPIPPGTKAKTYMFGSVYDKLRIQLTPERAVQFVHGRFWTTDEMEAVAVRLALSLPTGHHIGYHGTPGIAYGREIRNRYDVAALDYNRSVVRGERGR